MDTAKIEESEEIQERPNISPETRKANNYMQVKCAWCGGTGRWSIAQGDYASCVVCGGTGQVSVTGHANPCRQCRGSGKNNNISPCLTCAGTGWEKVSGQ